jgi:hypothetical protein
LLIVLYLPSVRTKYSNPLEYFFIFSNLKIMFKSLNFIYIYIVAVFLAIGCVKESLSSDQTDAILAMAHTDHPEGPTPDPEVDCKCYMRVTGAENTGGLTEAWVLFDTLNQGQDYRVSGAGQGWYPQGGGAQQPFPTPFEELSPPSNGWHTFILAFDFSSAPLGFKLFTEVRCYLQNGDGTESLMTTTYHTFDFYGEGIEMPQFLPNKARLFMKFFSCLVQTVDPPKG